MEKQKKRLPTRELLLTLLVVGVTAFTAWLIYYKRQAGVTEVPPPVASNTKTITNFQECVDAGNPVMESFPEQCAANGKTFVNESQKAQNNGWNTTVVSGKKAFEAMFPDGIGTIIKPLDSDGLFVMGTDQPTIKVGGAIKVEEMDSFGTDAPAILSINLINGATDTPQGTIEPYTLVNGKVNSIEGKKYTYIYPEDIEFEIGAQRYKDDRDYTYLFTVPGGKQLIVTYHMYGSESVNNLEAVEQIIDSIKLK